MVNNNMTNIKSKIESLRDQIENHNMAYHVINEPMITDKEYDDIMSELIKLEEKYPQFKSPSSPTARVGSDLTNEFNKVKHKYPMLSISNSYNLDDVKSFVTKVLNEITPSPMFVSELKIDGFSISLTYKNGCLVQAVTRGNGEIGDDVTENVKTISDIPLKIDLKDDLEVRGEIYIEKKSLEEINKLRLDEGLQLYSNPRNLASGSIKLLNSKDVAKRPLRFFAYWFRSDTYKINCQNKSLQILWSLGFKVAPYATCKNIHDIESFINKYKVERDLLPFSIDGIVVKVSDFKIQERIGYTSKSPKFFTAFKFEPEQARTKLLSITNQIGRMGTITPVAELEPVDLDGTIVKRATLHNYDELAKKDIRVGDIVIVEKAGDIIPQVVSVIFGPEHDKLPITLVPKFCPVCGSELIKEESKVALRCSSPTCLGSFKGRITHFISKDAMDIDGFGESTVEALIEAGLINNFSDIYKLRKEDLINIDRMGEKSATNLLNAIEESKSKPFQNVLYALGIQYIGRTLSKALVKYFKSYDDIKLYFTGQTKIDFKLNNVGEIILDYLYKIFKDIRLQAEVDNLKAMGLNFKSENIEVTQVESSITNKMFVLTGTLDSMTRSEASKLIEGKGGIVGNSITKKTDYLVCGKDSGSKKDKAIKMGIKIIEEKEFLEMVK